MNVDKLPGIKEEDLLKCGCCPLCHDPLISPKHGITFYRVTIERAGLEIGALNRRMGLQAMLGGSDAIARAMGPDDDLAKIFDGPHQVIVHETCAGMMSHLLELVPKDAASKAAE